MTGRHFDSLEDGRSIRCLVLGAEPGVVLQVLTLGATMHSLEVTGGDGVRRNVVLGRPTAADHLRATDYIGGTIGRYANRIAHGRFPLDARTVQVGTHDRGHHLHGGPDGFDRRLWDVEEHSGQHAVLSLRSPDGDQGFPGALVVRARFEVVARTVRLVLTATAEESTVVNLTSHVYFNLDGEDSGSVHDHELSLTADEYTPVDSTGIPVGGHSPVAGTAFDFRRSTRIGSMVGRDEEQVTAALGVDHNLVVRGEGLRTAAVLLSRRSGIRMELRSDQPGLQVYTGNHLDGDRRTTSGGRYGPGAGVALEPQLFPDTPNHPEWPSARLDPGQTYRSEMVWDFTVAACGGRAGSVADVTQTGEVRR